MANEGWHSKRDREFLAAVGVARNSLETRYIVGFQLCIYSSDIVMNWKYRLAPRRIGTAIIHRRNSYIDTYAFAAQSHVLMTHDTTIQSPRCGENVYLSYLNEGIAKPSNMHMRRTTTWEHTS